jgi:hypothetical protein
MKKGTGSCNGPVSYCRSGSRIQRCLDGLFAFVDLRLALCSSPFRFIEKGIRTCHQDTVFEDISVVGPVNDIRSIFFEIIFKRKTAQLLQSPALPGSV